jgi:urease accessory protein
MPQTVRALSYLPPGVTRSGDEPRLALAHDERRVRRRLLTLSDGTGVLIDFPTPITLEHGSALPLDDGRTLGIDARPEALYAVTGRDLRHLMQLSWHLGNRHLKTEIESRDGLPTRLKILRDHVIRDMLLGLGATVAEVTEPFSPEEGAYAHGHAEAPHALLNR